MWFKSTPAPPGGIAQLVEHLLCKQNVGSSILPTSTMIFDAIARRGRNAIDPCTVGFTAYVRHRDSTGDSLRTRIWFLVAGDYKWWMVKPEVFRERIDLGLISF